MKHTRTFLFSVALVMLGWISTSCNKCRNVECQNGGVCNKGNCECPLGFEGVNCEIVSAENTQNFVGIYDCSRTCSQPPGSDPVIIEIELDSNDALGLIIFEEFIWGEIKAKVTGPKTFSIPSQPYHGHNSATMSGSGSISDSTISMTYKYTMFSNTINCTFSGVRQ